MPLDFNAAARRYRAQKERIRQIVAAGERPLRFGDCLVSMDPRRPGAWRMTWFLEDGTPGGHIESETFAGALEEARLFGAEL